MPDQLTELVRPFTKKLIQKAPQGKFGDYVGHSSVTEKLLAVLGPFDFEVVETIRGFAPEVSNGKYPARENAIVGCLARLTVTVDGRQTTIQEVGTEDTPAMHNDAENLKNAASDAFKRCSMRLGVGLHLWSGDLFFLYDYLASRGGDGPREAETAGGQGEGKPSAPTDAGEGGGDDGEVAPPPEPAGWEASPPITASQRSALYAAGLPKDQGLRLSFLARALGREIVSSNDVRQSEFDAVLAACDEMAAS